MTYYKHNTEHRDNALKSQTQRNLSTTLRSPILPLPVTSVIENNILFQTRIPVTFNYLRNKNKSFKHPDPARFGQNLEPSGRYILHDTNPEMTKKHLPDLETGIITFKNPLVIEHVTTTSDMNGWKYKLSKYFNNKTGKKLSRYITSNGYDGIITVDKDHTSEIVDLTMFIE